MWATGSGDGRGEEVGVRVGCGDGSGARVVVGAAVTREGASGESLAASEHAAATMIRKIGTNRDETTRVRLGISITYPRLYHSFCSANAVPTWPASTSGSACETCF